MLASRRNFDTTPPGIERVMRPFDARVLGHFCPPSSPRCVLSTIKVFACFQCGSTLKAIYITLRRVRDLALRFLRCLNQHIAEDLQQFRC